MGGVSGMLGLGGGAGGSGFAGPRSANVVSPASQKQAEAALAQQQAFVQATQAQNGLGHQTDVYNQLAAIAQGQGPNPAQAQLAQSTGANVANQAALMAGQRGSNANVGLLARQAAMQGANIQQQAAGQGATMQAQQSLGAIQGMGNLANQQAGQQAAATSGYTGDILNAIANTNNANVGMQSNINNANAGMANTRMGQQGQMLGNIMGGVGSAFGLAHGGEVPYAEGGVVAPAAAAPQKGPMSNVGKHFNFDMSAPASGSSMMGQTIGKAIGSGLKSLFGSSSADSANPYEGSGFSQEQMETESARNAAMEAGGLPMMDPLQQQYGMQNPQQMMPAGNSMAGFVAAHGGKVPAIVSPGEQYLPPKDVKKVVKEGKNPLEVGEKILGKPKVKGDSYKNDTVHKDLESGGIVIPNSIMQSEDPAHEAYKFIAAIQAKHGKKLPNKKK